MAFWFYFILGLCTSAINAARNAKIVLLQQLFYFITHVRTALELDNSVKNFSIICLDSPEFPQMV